MVKLMNCVWVVLGIATGMMLGGCGTAPNGDETLFGQDIGVKATAAYKAATIDVQNFIASLPTACQQAEAGVAFTQTQLSVAQQVMKVPPKTVADLNNIGSDIVTLCMAEGL